MVPRVSSIMGVDRAVLHGKPLPVKGAFFTLIEYESVAKFKILVF